MTEDTGDRITRRRFLKTAIKGTIGAAGLYKLGELSLAGVKGTLNSFEQNQSHTTDAQIRALEKFNQTEARIKQNPWDRDLKQAIIYTSLKTGPDGAILRSIPEPPNKDFDGEKNNFEWKKWEADKIYNIPAGAILVEGKDRSNAKGVKGAWYFIVTQRDPQTNKATGGFFSESANFPATAQANLR